MPEVIEAAALTQVLSEPPPDITRMRLKRKRIAVEMVLDLAAGAERRRVTEERCQV